MDSFYLNVDKSKIDVKNYNFDHPNALDWDAYYEAVKNLLEGKDTVIPVYDFCTHSRAAVTEILKPSNIILLEGILCLYDERIRNLMDYKLFVYCDDDVRLSRRLLRDIKDRGRTLEGGLY